MAQAIAQCYHTLDRYGRDAQGLEVAQRLFIRVLGGYPASEVIPAFEKHVAQSRNFPTPSDIVGILEGRVKRDASYYRRLLDRIKAGDFLSEDESRYLHAYERQVLDGI